MGEVYAPRTIAGRRSGLRHWAHFACNLMGWDLLLFQQPVEQSVDSILTAETKIMCFARYLVRDYKSSTVIKYCYDVQSAHLTRLGAPLNPSTRIVPIWHTVLIGGFGCIKSFSN